MARRPIHWCQSILLLAVVLPIGMAEGNPFYFAATAVAVPAAWWYVVRGGKAMFGPQVAHGLIFLAFVVTLVEYYLLGNVLILALAHFMILAGVVKLLQVRSLRDDALLFILILLLLVIGSIVSGDMVFAVALALTVMFGLVGLMRLHLAHEQQQVLQVAAGRPPPGPAEADGGSPVDVHSLRGPAFVAAVAGLAVGGVVFLVCPRFESSLLRELQATSTGHTVTGLSGPVTLGGGGMVLESDLPVMRVKITTDPSLSKRTRDWGEYFRGTVAHQYLRRLSDRGVTWGWHTRDRRDASGAVPILLGELDGRAMLWPRYRLPAGCPQIGYRFYLEPRESSMLLIPYGTVEVASREFTELRYDAANDLARVQRLTGKVLRYDAVSVPREFLASIERDGADEDESPRVFQPSPPLPRADEILQRVDEKVGEAGALDDPGKRKEFLDRLQHWLRSRAFTYTLSPPSVPLGQEPLGAFILNHHEGNCDYFASAMAVICHLKGIPARLVGGYRGGDHNEMGDFYVIREKHAHSWVEAFVPGQGWVPFDPTPGQSRPDPSSRAWLIAVRTYVDYFQFQWANLVVTYDESARRDLLAAFRAWLSRPVQDETTIAGAVVAFVRELFGWRLQLSFTDRMLYWVFALLVVLLVAMVGYALWRIARGLMRWARWWGGLRLVGGQTTDGSAFYRQYRRSLEALDLHRPAGQTPAEYADDLGRSFPVLAEAAHLVAAYYETAFGGRQLGEDRRSRVEAFLRVLRGLDRERLEEESSAAAQGLR